MLDVAMVSSLSPDWKQYFEAFYSQLAGDLLWRTATVTDISQIRCTSPHFNLDHVMDFITNCVSENGASSLK